MASVSQPLCAVAKPWDVKEQLLWSASSFLSIEKALENAASVSFLLTGLSLRLLRYLGIGAGWITKLAWLMTYAALLLPGFLQAMWYYFFSSNVRRNIRYGPAPRNMLDIYLPSARSKQEELCPVVVFVTGGAWIIGYKGWGALLGQSMEENGVIVACLDYRNFPQGSVSHMVSDVSSGISWVLGNIERFGGDPRRVYLVGQSAGAHLAATAVMHNALYEVRSQDRKARLLELIQSRQTNFKQQAGCLETSAASGTLSEPPARADQMALLKPYPFGPRRKLSRKTSEIEEVELETSELTESTSVPQRSDSSRFSYFKPSSLDSESSKVTSATSEGAKTQHPDMACGMARAGEISGPSSQPNGLPRGNNSDASTSLTSCQSEPTEASCSTQSSSSDSSSTSGPWTPASEANVPASREAVGGAPPSSRHDSSQGTEATADLQRLDGLCSSGPRWSASSLKAFVGVSGIYNLVSAGSHLEKRGLSRELFSTMMEGEGSLGLFSPELLALLSECRTAAERGLLPPMWLFHGTKDISVPDSISLAFATCLKTSGAESHCKLYPGKSHTDLIIQDPMRGGQDELVQDLLNIIDTSTLPGLRHDITFSGRRAKSRARMVPESVLCLAGIVSPF